MNNIFKNFKITIPTSLANFLYKWIKTSEIDSIIDDDANFLKIYEKCKNYTMTPKPRMYALYQAINYIVKAKINGDLVECGVWKGGNTMLMAHTLLSLKVTNKNIYLFDTFTGMTKPTKEDFNLRKSDFYAINKWRKLSRENCNLWAYSPLREVKENMFSTNYPQNNIIFVKGKVEKTIPNTAPKNISILRLDTDWYESTKHELKHLFPKLSKKGVLIIDDYGSWAGSKKAVDEYFKNKAFLFNRIDEDSRLIIKN